MSHILFCLFLSSDGQQWFDFPDDQHSRGVHSLPYGSGSEAGFSGDEAMHRGQAQNSKRKLKAGNYHRWKGYGILVYLYSMGKVNHL